MHKNIYLKIGTELTFHQKSNDLGTQSQRTASHEDGKKKFSIKPL